MNDPKRAELKNRITLAHDRDTARREVSLAEKVGDQALEARDRFVGFAKEHPVATVAGGVVLGIAIASLFRGPRRAARAGGARAAGLAALGSEIALAFATQLLGDAQDAGRSLRDGAAEKASSVADAAQLARRSIADRIAAARNRR